MITKYVKGVSWCAILLSATVFGCVKQHPAIEPEAPVDAEAAVLLKLDAEFCAATAQKGADGWVPYFAPNGTMASGEGPPLSGHEAIGKAMGPALAPPNSLTWQPTEARIWVPGKLGYTRGRYESTTTDENGIVQTRRGAYFTVWQKQADGSWKVLFDTGIPDEK